MLPIFQKKFVREFRDFSAVGENLGSRLNLLGFLAAVIRQH